MMQTTDAHESPSSSSPRPSFPRGRRRLATAAGALLLCAALGCSSGGADDGQGGQGGRGGSGGGGGQGGSGGDAQAKTMLRVRLYPYIPDPAGDQLKAMAQRIEAEFEQAHPEVDLVVNPSCFVDDGYSPTAVAEALGEEGTECPLELVETDMMLLGELVATGVLRPWRDLPEVDWHPAALDASTYDGEIYGVPRWLCGHFVFSRDAAVEGAGTVAELAAALDDLQTARPDMAGNLLGSWNLPSLYLDAWADTHGAEGVASALTTTMYDTITLDALSTFSSTCESGGANPCVDGTYDLAENFDLPAQRFAAAEVDATFGYSERLHTIRKSLPAGASPADIRISSAPLGAGSVPMLFTDSFIVGAKCTDGCAAAADAFVGYMTSASTYEWIMMSEDAPTEGRVPRYLMSASLDAYASPGVRQDPFYPTIDALTRRGESFPNSGVLGVKDEMTQDILAALTGAP
jgi:thiamine pyridinylase